MSETPRKPRPNTPLRAPRNPAEEAARLLRSPPVGSAVGDEPPAGIQHVKGGSSEGETLIVGQRLVRQVGPLFDLIRHKDTQMPLTAAIYGPWGSGKTTAMRWLDRMLECWQKEGPKLIGNQQMTKDQFVDVRTVWFYPWKYQNRDDVLRGIIAEVIRATITVHGADAKTVQDAIRRFGGFLGRSFLSVLDSVELTGKLGADGTGAEAKVDLGFAREIAEEFDRTNHPEKAFLNHFEETLCAWTKRTIPKGKRLVVFIDDLDRCLPRIALQVLEALKLYLRVPEVIFVVGVDREVIARLVDKIYTEDQVEGVDAARYLAKMFQVEVTLDAEEDLAQGFFEHVTRGHHVWDMLKAAPEQRVFLREYILHHADRNPREIKRLFNGVMMAAVGHLHDAGGPEYASEREVASCLLRGARRFLIRHRLEHWRSGTTMASKQVMSESDRATVLSLCRQYDVCIHAIGTRFFTAFCDEWSRAAVDEDSELDAKIRDQVNFEPYVFLLDDSWLDRVVQLGVGPSDERDETGEGAVVVRPDPVKLDLSVPSAEPPDEIDPAACRRAILAGETEELRTIRDAVALAVNEKPEDLTDDHLLACKGLDLSGTGVADLMPLAGLTGLKWLNLDGTGVTDLTPLAGLTGLQVLDFRRTGVADLTPLAGLTGLQVLYLNRTGVADLTSLAGLTGLQVLKLSVTGVADLRPLAGLTGLQVLDLSVTGVADLTPLAGLNGLQELELSGTNVTDVTPLAKLTGLKDLNLNGTGVADLTPLTRLGLQHLYLRNARVTDEKVVQVRESLPNCHIVR